MVACSGNQSRTSETFQIADGFIIESFITEPLISDPVAMEIDENGLIYVVEMQGYPLDVRGSGKIKILLDTSRDGYPDKSIVYADSLTLPTGIMRWKNGVIVTDAPDVIYLEDSDGDYIADIKKVLLTGFARSNPQHNLNTPLLGPDNWIYLAHEGTVHTANYDSLFGGSGDSIRVPGVLKSVLPVNASGRSLRFNPETNETELLSSKTQFGHSFDPYGNYFLVTNWQHIYQEIIPERYRKRNEWKAGNNPVAYISDHGDAADVYPITENAEHQLLTDVGVFTSACGITYYDGGLFGPAWENVAFVAEPVHNLVHADKLTSNGATQKASRIFPDKEFLASKDPWFRPVNFYVGPDGALYVIDYYRKIIEHPEWMSDEVNKSGQLYTGSNQGRIYRITPKGSQRPEFAGEKLLDSGNAQVLIKNLSSTNGWYRKNARRILSHQKNQDLAEDLRSLIQESDTIGAVQALYVLKSMNALRDEDILRLLKIRNEFVRIYALRIAETRADNPEIAKAIIEMANIYGSDQLRFQAVLTTGQLNSDTAAAIIAEATVSENSWILSAAMTAKTFDPIRAWNTGLQSSDSSSQHFKLLERLAYTLTASDAEKFGPRVIEQCLKSSDEPWVANALSGIISAVQPLTPQQKLKFSGSVPEIFHAFINAPDKTTESWGTLWKMLASTGQRSQGQPQLKKLIQNGQTSDIKKSAAISLFVIPASEIDHNHIAEFLKPSTPAIVQQAALNWLSEIIQPNNWFGDLVISKWATFTPERKNQAINLMVLNNNPTRIAQLIGAMEQNKIDPAVIGWRRSVRLMTQSDDDLRSRARKLLDQFRQDESAALKSFGDVDQIQGNSKNGKLIFQQYCSSCHQIGEKNGVAFGPDLSTIKNQQKQAILSHIVLPEKSIADGYEKLNITLNNGEKISGIVAEETMSEIKLKTAPGQLTIIRRESIQELTADPESAMPSGFGQSISPENMHDLLAYLKNYHKENLN
jgi:hypothetical protein